MADEKRWQIYICPNCGRRKGGPYFCHCTLPAARCTAVTVVPKDRALKVEAALAEYEGKLQSGYAFCHPESDCDGLRSALKAWGVLEALRDNPAALTPDGLKIVNAALDQGGDADATPRRDRSDSDSPKSGDVTEPASEESGAGSTQCWDCGWTVGETHAIDCTYSGIVKPEQARLGTSWRIARAVFPHWGTFNAKGRRRRARRVHRALSDEGLVPALDAEKVPECDGSGSLFASQTTGGDIVREGRCPGCAQCKPEPGPGLLPEGAERSVRWRCPVHGFSAGADHCQVLDDPSKTNDESPRCLRRCERIEYVTLPLSDLPATEQKAVEGFCERLLSEAVVRAAAIQPSINAGSEGDSYFRDLDPQEQEVFVAEAGSMLRAAIDQARREERGDGG